MIDLIDYHFKEQRPKIECLNYGFVSLVDIMPRVSYDENITTCDHAIVQAARVSYGDGTKKVSEDRGLIRYLMRHAHTTPFEMVEMKLHCSMPIFIARQWIRTRTANVNESSARYSIMKDEFWTPDAKQIRIQSKENKQMSEGLAQEGDAQWFANILEEHSNQCYEDYEKAIDKGIAREQARTLLPVNVYTQWYWKIDLHNLLHFLSLRCDDHAQPEIQEYGNAILDLIRPLLPWTIEAWEDYHPRRGAMLLTKLELEAIRRSIQAVPGVDSGISAPELDSDNKRENKEWAEKAQILGFIQKK